MRIATDFEGARIEVRGVQDRLAHLTIASDRGAPRFRQHFAFDVLGQPGESISLDIENAGECTWADAFGGPYRVFVSNGSRWERAQTSFEGGRLSVRHELTGPRARFAYYPPFPSSRLTRLRKLARASGARVDRLAETAGSRPIERYAFGDEKTAKSRIWVIAQQHPGEAMAGWFVEGLVLSLASDRALSRELRQRAMIYVVPRMNPDGAAIGNHRTTPSGVDLNRSWADEAAPVEVRSVRGSMRQTGADVMVDVHGDERLPWVFAQCADAYPGRAPRIGKQEKRFERAMTHATPDFQTKHRYPYDPSGRPNLAFASNWAQKELGCLAMVLEMPFSDHLGRPDARGFSPERARALGRATLSGLLAALET
jgi:murein tripeptide amidase MpaA